MVLQWMKGVDDGKPIFPTYFEAIVQALYGRYVESGLEVLPVAGQLAVTVANGEVFYEGKKISVAGTTLTLDPETVGNVRYDVIVYDGADNTIKVLKGSGFISTAEGNISKTQRLSETQIPIAIVRVIGGATEIATDDIFDVRLGSNAYPLASNFRYNFVEVSSDYQAQLGDFVLVDATNGTVTVTLPSPGVAGEVVVKKVDASTNSVIVVSLGGELIDGETQIEITMQDEAYRFVANNGKWIIV